MRSQAQAWLYYNGMEQAMSIKGPIPTSGLVLTKLDGFYSTPDLKTSTTERQTADGGTGVEEQDILYSSRTVTIDFAISGSARQEVQSILGIVSSMAHHYVRFRVFDGENDTFVTGYASIKYTEGFNEYEIEGTITLICDTDPYRYSTMLQEVSINPTASVGGLTYSTGLEYPLNYGVMPVDSRNYLYNAGSVRAYPTIVLHGSFNVCQIIWNGRTFAFQGGLSTLPAVIDCRQGVATLGGSDISSRIIGQVMPYVDDSATFSMFTDTGKGFAELQMRETYI